MEFASDMPNCGALGRPHGSRSSALGECGPLPSAHCTIAKVDTLIAEHRETTSPQAACDSLRDSERRPHPATGNGPIAIAHCDTEGRYKFVNRHYAERRGLTPEQVVGKRILHELATNAGKYGALSTDTGRVDVRWETDGNLLAMSWTECDGPPVCEPKQRGFGSIVIEAMAEYSVDGAVDLHYAPFGVTWRLTCPAANALEPRGT